jgi:hypothetical protein
MRKVLWLSVLATLGLFTNSLSASIFSTANGFNFTNCGGGAGGGVTVTASSIIWAPAGTLANYGCIETGAGTSVSSTISGLVMGPNALGNISNEPGAPPAAFLVFPAAGSNPSLTLNFLLPTGFSNPVPGVGFEGTGQTACSNVVLSGESCLVLAGSPFLLTLNAQGNTTVTLLASGTVADPNNVSQISQYTLQFSTQLTGAPSAIYSAICPTAACQGSDGSTYSAQGSITFGPEPGTIGMMLIGAGLLTFSAKKRLAKK